MNNINRGVLVGLRITLENIAETLENMSANEEAKEDGFYDNVPIAESGEISRPLYLASQMIWLAIKYMREVAPQVADFEEE